MSEFKDIISADRTEVFLNFDEYGEKHTIDGTECVIVIDNNERLFRSRQTLVTDYVKVFEQSKARCGGIFKAGLLFFIRSEDMPKGMPRIGREMKVDDNYFIVTDAINEDGIFSITLEARDN